MTKNNILSTSVIILGLFFFVRFVQEGLALMAVLIGSLTWPQTEEGYGYLFVAQIIPISLYLLFTYVGVFKSKAVANFILKENDEFLKVEVSKPTLIETSLAIIAVLAILYSIPYPISQLIENIYFHDHKEVEFWTIQIRVEFVQNVVLLVAGIFLLFNARNFAKSIVKIGDKDDEQSGNHPS